MYNFLEYFHFFLEMTIVSLTPHLNNLCPVRSEVLYFGQRTYSILKPFLFLFYLLGIRGLDALEGSKKVPAICTEYFLKNILCRNFIDIFCFQLIKLHEKY
jgi:hypothetical protein